MEREVGGLGAPGHPVDVGRHERERVARVAAVLGEMEADPPHHVPQPALLPQPARESAGRRPRTLGEHAPEIAPEPFEDLGGDEFGAGHRGNRFGVSGQPSRIGLGVDEGPGFQRIERRTGAGDEHPPEVTPELQGRMEVGPGLRHPEVQDPGGRTFGKGREDPPLCRGGEFRARFAGSLRRGSARPASVPRRGRAVAIPGRRLVPSGGESIRVRRAGGQRLTDRRARGWRTVRGWALPITFAGFVIHKPACHAQVSDKPRCRSLSPVS